MDYVITYNKTRLDVFLKKIFLVYANLTVEDTFEVISHRASIAGHITDLITRQAIPNVAVEVVGQNLQTLTGKDGFFYFIDLSVGQYMLRVSTPRLGSRYRTTTDVPDVAVENEPDGRPIFDSKANVQLSPTRVVGEVKRSDNNQPIENAVVQLRGSGIQTLTDDRGEYILSSLVKGNPTVQAVAQGFLPSTQTVTLTAGEETIANFSLVEV